MFEYILVYIYIFFNMQFPGKYQFNVVYHVGAKMAFSMLTSKPIFIRRHALTAFETLAGCVVPSRRCARFVPKDSQLPFYKCICLEYSLAARFVYHKCLQSFLLSNNMHITHTITHRLFIYGRNTANIYRNRRESTI